MVSNDLQDKGKSLKMYGTVDVISIKSPFFSCLVFLDTYFLAILIDWCRFWSILIVLCFWRIFNCFVFLKYSNFLCFWRIFNCLGFLTFVYSFRGVFSSVEYCVIVFRLIVEPVSLMAKNFLNHLFHKLNYYLTINLLT